MTTTEPAPSGRLVLSVRTRLTVVVALLTGLALATAGLIVYALEVVRLDNALVERADQQVAELRALQAGNDPATARPFDSVESLLRLHLARNVPDDDELLAGWWNGRPQIQISSPQADEEVLFDRDFRAAVRRLAADGGDTRLDTQWGDVVVAVQPVRNAAQRGDLVLVYFVDVTRAELERVMGTYAVVSLLLLTLITGAAAWQAGRLLRPLRTLRTAAETISVTDLSRRIPETGNDDITALTRTFNQMLVRLDRAFTGQREFLDDAGHELRTPLTVLRGHLELVDPGDEAEVAAVRDLLLDEVDRMSLLVEDLILLAKADRPDFFRLAPVNLAPFLGTLLEKCRALGDREWMIDESAEFVAVLDEQRITQAVLQLAQNAVKHTDPGHHVALGSSVDAEQGLRIWVRDTGPGVADTDKIRIFERFARGSDAAGDDDGFGLGLSIVSAIASAHGGRVEVTDASGGGAVFTLVLPAHLDNEPWPGS